MKMKFTDLRVLDFGHSILMTGAIYSGNGKSYALLFPEDKNDTPLETIEMTDEDWNALLKQTDLLEVEALCPSGVDFTFVKAMVRKSQRQIDQTVSWKVYKRDDYRCRYCGKDDVPLTVDHLVRWEERGPSIVENLVSACKKCNRVRGDASYAGWLRHSYYLKVSAGISPETKAANEALVSTLDAIPRVKHPRSR